jgi:hypothetical protein
MTSAGFDIEFVFKGDQQYSSAFEKAAERWERIIVDDLPDVGKIDDLRIQVHVANIDGAGGVLGQAAPTFVRTDGGLPCKGLMRFDVSDVADMRADGTLVSVIMHEMGHVLGLGTLWDAFNFIDRANAGYTGEHALAAYRQLTGNLTTPSIPLETTGGAGTAFGHWSEARFDDEIMTGYAGGDMDVSSVTIGALEDLGYAVNYAYADAFVL